MLLLFFHKNSISSNNVALFIYYQYLIVISLILYLAIILILILAIERYLKELLSLSREAMEYHNDNGEEGIHNNGK